MDEDAVNGQIFHLVAECTNGEDVDVPLMLYILSSEVDPDRSDGLHPFADVVGAHCVVSFCCKDLKCLIVALGGASWEIGSRFVSNGK